MAKRLTHFDASGRAHMVGVEAKPETLRAATASARIRMRAATAKHIRQGTAKKGDVLGTARLAAISATKQTAQLIPLCHPLRITGVEVHLTCRATWVDILATVRAFDRTGVEMEALTAASVAALTIYDMCKAIDRAMVIERIQLEAKAGGRSGTYQRRRS